MINRYLNSFYTKALLLLIIIYLLSYIHSFHIINRNIYHDRVSISSKQKIQMQLNTNRKANLNENSVWKVNMKLQKQGYKDIDTALKIRFISDRNYEPPQGRIFIEDDYQGFIRVNEKGYSGLWTLSEDKNDRKDGLWIWGLFEEPKYPFLYFYLVLPSGEEEPVFNNDGIPNNRLYFRFNHVIIQDRGTVLSNGDISYKDTELISADPFALGGKVNIAENINIGIVDIVCLLNE